jgi:hypothetical protein
MLPLSTVDSHVGANLFLAAEMERSSFLFNFLRSRGAPMAIEIIEPSFSPPHLLLFYPKEKEVYAADIQQNENVRQWIVRGPFAIERQDYRQLMGLEASWAGVPVFMIWNREYRFRQEPRTKVATVLQPIIPTPRPAPPRTPAKKRPVITAAPAPQEPPVDPFIAALTNPQMFKPLNSDQQAIALSKGFARRAENGDLLHTVKAESETLKAIAKWYTGNEANAEELAGSSGASTTAGLAVGTEIRIPLSKIKQPKLMPFGYR